MPQLGISKGLSFVNDWEKDIDRVYQREEYAAGVRARKEQDAMFWANQLKKGHGSTPYMEGKYDAFAKEQTKKIADYAIANPGFRTDVTKLAEFQNLTGALLDNPILRQDLQVKAQYEKFQSAVAGGNLTELQIEKEHKKYNEYANADPNSDATPYVFENPRVITIPDLLTEDASLLKTRSDIVLNQSTHQYEDVSAVPIENIHDTASRRYSTEEGKLAIDRDYNATMKDHPEYASIPGYENALSWYTKSLEYLTEKKNSFRVWDYEWQKRQEVEAKDAGKDTNYAHAYIDRVSKFKNIPDGGKMTGTSYDLAFSRWEKTDNQSLITPSTGDLVWSKTGGEDGKGGYKTVDLNVTAKAIGASGIVNVGGIYYIKTDISFDTGWDNTFSSKTPMIDDAKLADYDFHSSEVKSSPLIGDDVNSVSFKQGQTHTGTILTPVILTETTMTNYDKQYLGLTQAGDIAPYYSNNTESMINKDPALIISELKQGRYPAGTSPHEGYNKKNNTTNQYFTIPYQGKKAILDIKTGDIYPQ